MRDFRRAMKPIMMHGPFPMEQIGMDPKMMHMLMRELEHSMSSEPQPEQEATGQPKSKKDEK